MENQPKYYNPEYDFVQSLNLERGNYNYFLKINFNQLEKIVKHYRYKKYDDLEFDILGFEEENIKTPWDDFVHIVNKYKKHLHPNRYNKETWLGNLTETYYLLQSIPKEKLDKAILYFQLIIENQDFTSDQQYRILDTSIEYEHNVLILEYSHITRYKGKNNFYKFLNQKQEQLQFYINNYNSDDMDIKSIDGQVYIDNLTIQQEQTIQKIKKLFNIEKLIYACKEY